VNRLDQETAKRRGPTRAVEPVTKKNNNKCANKNTRFNGSEGFYKFAFVVGK
jgi:hypothetical protein